MQTARRAGTAARRQPARILPGNIADSVRQLHALRHRFTIASSQSPSTACERTCLAAQTPPAGHGDAATTLAKARATIMSLIACAPNVSLCSECVSRARARAYLYTATSMHYRAEAGAEQQGFTLSAHCPAYHSSD